MEKLQELKQKKYPATYSILIPVFLINLLNTFYRLWHQLTNELESIIPTLDAKDAENIYAEYIEPVETHFNKMRWAEMVLNVAKVIPGSPFLRHSSRSFPIMCLFRILFPFFCRTHSFPRENSRFIF